MRRTWGNEVVGEGRQLLDPWQVGGAGAVEVGGGQLGALDRDVGEGAPGGEGSCQVGYRLRRLDYPQVAAVVLLVEVASDIA